MHRLAFVFDVIKVSDVDMDQHREKFTRFSPSSAFSFSWWTHDHNTPTLVPLPKWKNFKHCDVLKASHFTQYY